MKSLDLHCDCLEICPDIKKLRELKAKGDTGSSQYEDLADQYEEVCSTIGNTISQYCLIKKELRKDYK